MNPLPPNSSDAVGPDASPSFRPLYQQIKAL
ncbi:GntR family transcriptional regulator, partial [Halobellus sp. Atlit-31R]